ncbi:hypothetical protein [Flavobacterium macrobrachii]|jgi:hypothetical protein|uniref:hypothetical protein n=1 Tax=Flavobacterium macrobrachii TaxID=591204 RepID=UPI003F70937F
MKQKITTFLVGFLTYGLLFGAAMYYLETNKNLSIAIKSGIAFGFFMSLFELFLIPKIKEFFKKKNNS